ncbi:hypothetical protein CLU79DRAFT_735942 [Phycomyces nitens]|nr:hypothetical protein CLU79DRAFT_735942 [Phycomyces nitens]
MVDPGKRDAFYSYNGDDDIRRLKIKEYFNTYRSLKRMRNDYARKVAQGIKEVETHISSVKTTSREQSLRHTQYADSIQFL